MSDYNNGQIWGWNGGDCPVHPETVVKVWFEGAMNNTNSAKEFDWSASPPHCSRDYDIVAFQVVKAYVEPKVIWLNEYPNGLHTAYRTENDARAGASTRHTRIAVKYVEVDDE